MKLKIIQVGDPVLRTPARELSIDEILNSSTQQLIELMKITLRDAPGVGLAAPQIGELLQLAVIEDLEEYSRTLSAEQIQKRQRVPVPFHVIINPKITITNAEQAEFHEGCLSFAGFMGVVPRAVSVTVECLDEQAISTVIQATGWYARILQHEIDHLQGKLCIDHMKLHSLTTIENYTRYSRR